ncbi:hypothetical protein [Roseovarius salinarum]|uniref:hypothetical protein n=1 Tax=Roseovarius salinarum TaxID=1981892 RepID=UPI000C33ED80|nr:hypothetical protein [Roseovarius salinarum]
MERMKAILTLTAAAAFAASPLVTDGFAGFRPDQFPVPQVDAPVQPAGWAFAIWGLIYLWMIAGTGFGLLYRDVDPAWDTARWPLFASLVMGAAWIPVAQITPVWATVLIWAMLATALAALMRAGRRDGWWLQAPIGLYSGWLTAAACVALGMVLAGHGVIGQRTAALAMIALALAIGVAVQALRPGTPLYTVGLAWALVGILAENAAPLNLPVAGLAAVGIAVLVAGLVRQDRQRA